MSHLRSESNDILGGDWIQRHRKIVQQNANQYKRVAWAKVSASSAIGCICFFSILLLGVKAYHLFAPFSHNILLYILYLFHCWRSIKYDDLLAALQW
jgi:hypothetical protein